MKKSFLYGVTALGLLFTACQSDNPSVSNGEMSTEGERTVYVNVNIQGDTSDSNSRAALTDGNPVEPTDFADGTGESAVSDAYFVFYDVNGNQVGGEAVKVPLSNVEWKTNEDGTVEKYYKSVVGVTISNGQNNPSQVVCYINPQDPASLDDYSLADIQTQTRNQLYSVAADGTKYFSMSNSVFYTSTASIAPQIAVQIAPDQIYNTRTAAESALSSNAVNIYVERYAAKLSFKSAEPQPYVTQTKPLGGTASTVTLSFVPNKWMVNATCEDTYVVKSFRKESPTGDALQDNYGYNELNLIINKGIAEEAQWLWNSTDYHRSYWGMSPAYFTAEYPEVSSDVNQLTLYQKYYSYNELITGSDAIGYEVSTANAVTKYIHETTVGSKAIASKNIVAAFPAVILVGDYTVKVGSTTLDLGTPFYTYLIDESTQKPLVYFEPKKESTTGESSIENGASILQELLTQATVLYKLENGNYVNFDIEKEEDLSKLVAVFEVAAPSDDVKGSLKVPERYRTLQLREGVTSTQLDGIYVATPDGYKKIIADPKVNTPGANQITYLAANQELMNVVGYAALYSEGAAYFNIPVKHFGWYRKANTNKDKEEMDWTKVRVGDFGIVRNHTYNIEVSAITGLGTGIGGKDNPIVPPAEENRYYVAYQLNILKWAIVPTQSVNL